MNQESGKLLMIAGGVILMIGALLYFSGGKLNWIGNLPGDIKIERDNFKMYMPITTMILASIVLSVLFRIINKFF